MRNLVVFIIFLFSCGMLTGQQDGPVLLKLHALHDRGLYEDMILLSGDELLKDNDFRLYLMRGEAFMGMKDFDSAIRDFDKANTVKPGSGSLGLARAYADRGDAVASLKYLEDHLRSGYKSNERLLLRDPYLEKIEESPEWRRFWKTEWYTRLEMGVSEVEYLTGKDMNSEARTILNDLSYSYKGSPEISYISGMISYSEKDYGSAVEELGAAISGGYNSYRAQVSYINALYANTDYPAAALACNEAMEIFPERPELYLLRIECNRKSGQRDLALDDAKMILELYPEDELAVSKAAKLAFENKQYTESLRYLSINIKNKPGNSQYFIDRASVYTATRSWEFAIYDYTMALDLHPMDGEAYYNKGFALLKMGRVEDGCYDLKMAMRYGNKKASALVNDSCIR